MIPRQSVVVAGGIGSGKSQVLSLLSSLGWSVLKADELGHEVLMEAAVVGAISERWPAAVIRGKVSRPALATAVFTDLAELEALEDLIQPVIANRIDAWIAPSPKPAAVEISVLKVARPQWGPLLMVHAPMQSRRQRALERGMSADDVDARMAVQPTDSEFLARADIVIDNQSTMANLIEDTRRFDRWARSS